MKDYEDFDLQIRSMLDGAEEQVPSRIWSGISSRLDAIDAAAAPVHKSNKWGWTAAGIAVAAALGTGLFFIGTNDHNSNLINNNKESGLVALVDPVQMAEVDPESTLPLSDITTEEPKSTPQQAQQSFSPKAKAPVVAKSEPKEEPKAEPEAEPKAEKQPEAVQVAEPKQEEVEKENVVIESSVVDTNKEANDDPFAQMAFEDSRASKKQRHTSLYAGGSIATNDAGSSAIAMGVSGNSLNEIQETSESTYGIPLTLGLGVRYHFAPRWSVGTGIDYSLLTRTFTGNYGNEQIIVSDIRHNVQYIGIPLNLYYNILNSQKINFYVFGGGEGEYCISNKYKILEGGTVLSDPVDKLQYSVGGGLGLEFKLGKGVGLYLDPSVRYYFDCAQPKSIRTEKPFMINFQAGLRFNL